MKFNSNTVNGIALSAISAVFTLDSIFDVVAGKPMDSVLSGSIAALAGNAAKGQFDEAPADDKPTAVTNQPAEA